MGAECVAHRVMGRDLGIRHLARKFKPLHHTRTKARAVTLDKGTMGLPDFAALQIAEGPKQSVKIRRNHRLFFHRRNHALHFFESRRKHSTGLRICLLKQIRRQNQPWIFGQSMWIISQNRIGHTGKGFGIAREPAGGVKASSQRHCMIKRQTIMGRTDAEQTAIAGRSAHRPARIRTQPNIALPACGCRGRTRGRPARNTIRRCRIDRRAEMNVFSVERKSQFNRMGLADKMCARIEKQLHE